MARSTRGKYPITYSQDESTLLERWLELPNDLFRWLAGGPASHTLKVAALVAFIAVMLFSAWRAATVAL